MKTCRSIRVNVETSKANKFSVQKCSTLVKSSMPRYQKSEYGNIGKSSLIYRKVENTY